MYWSLLLQLSGRFEPLGPKEGRIFNVFAIQDSVYFLEFFIPLLQWIIVYRLNFCLEQPVKQLFVFFHDIFALVLSLVMFYSYQVVANLYALHSFSNVWITIIRDVYFMPVENFDCFWCYTCFTCWVSNFKFFKWCSLHNASNLFVQDCVILFNFYVASVLCKLLFSCVYLHDVRAVSLLVDRIHISQASPMRVIIIKIDLGQQ